ncbi:MAG TPA: hypothetical protein VKZ41_02710 [Gemmatimonadales bacterium]|nr:hypothetical protein [Gemmatimonadales bacterium]
MSSRCLTGELRGVCAAVIALLLFTAPLAAQVTEAPAPPDTVAPAARAVAADSVRGDTLKSPIPAGEVPPLPSIAAAYRWRGDEIMSSGALTLLDLLDNLPEVTGFRSGWLLPPEYAGVAGSFRGIRIFLDGVEIDAIDPRQDGLQDLGNVQLWPLEEVAVERGVDELRVHLRSWREEHTSPRTRIDVSTGDYNSNLYRGYFGKRFGRGEVIQLGGQQFSTRDPVFGGDGDRLSLVARVGVARPRWSVDGWMQRTSGLRSRLTRLNEMTPLEPLEHVHTIAYARAAFRAPEQTGLWMQAIASSQSFEIEAQQASFGTDEVADTARSRAQYVATVGWRGSGLSLSATGRMRVFEGESFITPSVRASYESPLWTFSAFAEQREEDETLRMDASATLAPLPFLALSGGVSSESPDVGDSRIAVRGEGGVRVRSLWLVGGVILTEDRPTGALTPVDPDFLFASTGDAAGVYGALRGPVWGGFRVDVTATRWNKTGSDYVYRPEFDVSGRVEYFNQWLEKFPRGNFHLRAAVFGNYASEVGFPQVIGTTPVLSRTTSAPGMNALLELRISDAYIMLQYRNAFGVDYETVPGYLMPRPTILYGVRWSFRN